MTYVGVTNYGTNYGGIPNSGTKSVITAFLETSISYGPKRLILLRFYNISGE